MFWNFKIRFAVNMRYQMAYTNCKDNLAERNQMGFLWAKMGQIIMTDNLNALLQKEQEHFRDCKKTF